MAILLTGAAGFIGFHTAQALLTRGETVFGIDNLNDYYDVTLKEARLNQLLPHPNFRFQKMDISDRAAITALPKDFDTIIHLAAQAGVRYSLENPQAYVDSNITGHLSLLELARATPNLKHFVYASSSSVYGGNTKTPFAVHDAVEKPVSLYAATKRANELMSQTYAHLFRIPATGLRFFTVYGPWGRPDMAAFLFAKNIMADKPIRVFNHGNMQRDFTYVDDIVAGVLAAMDKPPVAPAPDVPHQVFNLGNSHPEKLMDFIGAIESALGKKAIYNLEPLQAGDVPATSADIDYSTKILGFVPKISIKEGIPRFVAWYKDYYKV
jgi:UDP-glucuronate 4-epimerase